jgi:acetyl esterase/lipase
LELPDIGAEVRIPEGDGPFPAVVLVHGGGWILGDPSVMRGLANHLTDNGFLTVNTPYKLANDSPGFPDAVDDVACAVRYAAAHPDSDGTVAVVGHSAGAHLSAVVALTGDLYGAECPVEGSGVPDRLVGLAGPYDVDRLGIAVLPFFGAGPVAEPEIWRAGNPQLLTDENPQLISLIMYGDRDALVDPSFAIDFHDALTTSGIDSTLELVEEARHMDMRDPDWVGDLIVVWLER